MQDLNLFLFRLVVGLFFVLYRFRWVYDPGLPRCDWKGKWYECSLDPRWRWFNRERHARLEAKLMECGYWPKLAVPVAVVELAAGLALIVGLFTQAAAAGLLIILLAATYKTARVKVAAQKPVDLVDWASCYLWLSEPIYIVLCFALVCAGAGAWSLDAIFREF